MMRRNARAVSVFAGSAILVGALSSAVAWRLVDEARISSKVQRTVRPRLSETPMPMPVGMGAAQFPLEFRTIDAVGNNLANPEWGAAATPLLRLTPVGYADGLSEPAGADRPSPRHISNLVTAQLVDMPNAALASDYLWQWGQFLDHDLDETPIASPAEHLDIEVPMGDEHFDPLAEGGKLIALDRSAYDTADPVRQQINNITAFIDASNVYGSDATREAELRTNDGTGRLKLAPNGMLPKNINAFDNAPSAADPTMYLAGDIRCNEQIALTAMHTLFVREHNFHADRIRTQNPGLTGEEVYQHARAIVAAEMQAITYNEFLPMLLGEDAIPPYTGYDPAVNPGIANVFATAAYRVGHTMLSSTIARLGPDNLEAPEGHIPLLSCFFKPSEIENNDIDSILRGLASKPSQTIDNRVIDDIRNFLFGPPGAGGFDLASLNIQRGRDHGLATYNQIRMVYGRSAVASFDSINPDPAVHTALAAAYASPHQIDAWVGLLAEPHRTGALVGETLWRVLRDQFIRLRDGDRFWYEAYLPPAIRDQVNADTLAVIIRRNTNIGDELRDDVFSAAPPPICVADVYPDDAVNIIDFSIFVDAFGTADPLCDFDDSGFVDTFDFAIFISEFGKLCIEE
jgi:hypothetical protein